MNRSCVNCKYYRQRKQIKLFDARNIQSAAALKAQIEWDQEVRERARLERQRLLARDPFNYEPYNFAWCSKTTPIDDVEKARAGDSAALEKLMQNGGAEMNSVTGEITALYILCDWKNPSNDCEDYEKK